MPAKTSCVQDSSHLLYKMACDSVFFFQKVVELWEVDDICDVQSVCAWGWRAVKTHCTEPLCARQSLLFIPYHQKLFSAAPISIPDGRRYNCFLTVLLLLQRVVQHRAKLATHYDVYTSSKKKSKHWRNFCLHSLQTNNIAYVRSLSQAFVKCEM